VGPVSADAAPRRTNVFDPRTVIAVVTAGVLGFLLFLILTAFAGHLRGGGSDPRAHALSRTAIGFHGLVRLIQLSGGTARLIRDESEHGTDDLLIVMVEEQTDPERLAELLDGRENRPTLVVLPKWTVQRDPARPGRVVSTGLYPPQFLERMLGELEPIAIAQRGTAQGAAPGSEPGSGPRTAPALGSDILSGISAPAPQTAQTATGPSLIPLLLADKQGALLVQIGDAPHYLLADPDLMNNQGLANPATARAALEILAALNSTGARGVAFDLTLNGFAVAQNPLRLAFEPPYLPLTLALFVAALLAGLHGAFRFGAPAEEGRAVAFGKAQLVENSAGLFKLARREHRAGDAYAALVREAAAADSGAHLALRDAELDAYLDRVSPPERPFSALAERARAAATVSELLAAARALFQWKKDLLK
jgi:hypothetical protein